VRSYVNNLIRRLLGLNRFQELAACWNAAGAQDSQPSVSHSTVFVAILVALLPLASAVFASNNSANFIITLAVGCSALFAVVFRLRNGLMFSAVLDWKRSLSLTHTAFALGCIPALIIAFTDVQALSGVHKEAVTGSTEGQGVPMGSMILWIIQVSLWAGITEELIFRGLVVSVVRRWRIFASQRHRDLLAVILGALLFGLSHLPTWGPAMSLAIVGLGLGFGVAFIATGEQIMPLIVYHVIFDLLSLSAALFMRS